MPSPFPGMDPYLEHPALWPGVHQGLITFMWSALNAMLPERYVASMGERVYVVQAERDIYPDVMVVQRPSPHLPATSGTAGTAAVADPYWVVTITPEERREVFLEIIATGEEQQVITVIEVLSPANKVSGQGGWELYVTKQREILSSNANLIEIDLLRRGTHTVAVPYESIRRQGPWHYLTCLHRGGHGARYEVWAVTVRQRLPRVAVPLALGDADLVLDLQMLFNRCYDEGAYGRRINYREAPPQALSSEDALWAEALLRTQHMRA